MQTEFALRRFACSLVTSCLSCLTGLPQSLTSLFQWQSITVSLPFFLTTCTSVPDPGVHISPPCRELLIDCTFSFRMLLYRIYHINLYFQNSATGCMLVVHHRLMYNSHCRFILPYMMSTHARKQLFRSAVLFCLTLTETAKTSDNSSTCYTAQPTSARVI